MEQSTIILISSLLFVFLGLVFVVFSISFINASQTSRRIQSFIVNNHLAVPSQEITVSNIKFSGSFLRRMTIPMLRKIISFLGKTTPSQTIKEVNRQLALAGVTSIKAQQFYGIRFLLLTAGIIWLFIDYPRNPDIKILAIDGGIILCTFILPILWLRIKAQRRQEEIKKSLADALDILAISTAAGLGFDQALLRVSQIFKSASGQEFSRIVSEIEIGVSRQDALRNFSDRVRISEISSFVAVIIQSEILGMSISDVLHTQAEQMRVHRQFWIKEMAQRLPVKMMVPLAFLILPALIAVLLGPMVPAILEIF